MSRRKDITGQKFGRLTVVGLDEQKSSSQRSYWLCKCDCGNPKIQSVYLCQLTSGKTSSCGCLHREKASEANYRHGYCTDHKERLYSIWDGMKQRCCNPSNKRYKDYGGRGITVYKDWLDFINFKEWAIKNGYSDTLTIERIDVNKNYEPSNCTWATMNEQYKNKRNTKYVLYQGQEVKLLDLLEELNIKQYYKKITHRLDDLHWTTEKAISNL